MKWMNLLLSALMAIGLLVAVGSCDKSDDDSGSNDDDASSQDPIGEEIPAGMGRIWGYVSIQPDEGYNVAGGVAAGATVTLFEFISWTNNVEKEAVEADDQGLYHFDVEPGNYVLRSHDEMDPPAEGCSLNEAQPHENDQYYTLEAGQSTQVDLLLSVACSACKSGKGC